MKRTPSRPSRGKRLRGNRQFGILPRLLDGRGPRVGVGDHLRTHATGAGIWPPPKPAAPPARRALPPSRPAPAVPAPEEPAPAAGMGGNVPPSGASDAGEEPSAPCIHRRAGSRPKARRPPNTPNLSPGGYPSSAPSFPKPKTTAVASFYCRASPSGPQPPDRPTGEPR